MKCRSRESKERAKIVSFTGRSNVSFVVVEHHIDVPASFCNWRCEKLIISKERQSTRVYTRYQYTCIYDMVDEPVVVDYERVVSHDSDLSKEVSD